MSADAKFRPDRPPAHDVRKVNFAPLAWSFAANAVVQFAIQAWLAYSFAAHVWHLPGPLPYFAPVALDAFIVNMMIVAYELRGAKLRTRLYVWLVLALGIGAQIGAAEGYAAHVDWGTWARVASFAPALLLAASLHTLIIRRKHLDPPTDGQGRDADTSAQPVQDDDVPAANQAPKTQRPARPTTPPATPPVSGGSTGQATFTKRPGRNRGSQPPPSTALQDKARTLVGEGRSCAEVAQIVGKSKRWVELHTVDIRAGHAPSVTAEIADPATGGGRPLFPRDDAADQPAIAGETSVDLSGDQGESAT